MHDAKTLWFSDPPKDKWRRFSYALCLDCNWCDNVRDYRSRRAINRKRAVLQAAQHQRDNPDHLVTTGIAHG
jgi:hypothetical protein